MRGVQAKTPEGTCEKTSNPEFMILGNTVSLENMICLLSSFMSFIKMLSGQDC